MARSLRTIMVRLREDAQAPPVEIVEELRRHYRRLGPQAGAAKLRRSCTPA
jgi:hypothetical protein